MISQRSEQLNHYIVDFQKGLHTLQEHFITGISKTKTKGVSDVGALADITGKLTNLDKRQGKILVKLDTLHRKFAKNRGLDRIDQELLSLQAVIEDSIRQIERRGLDQVVQRTQELSGIFKEIVENQQGFENLRSAKELGITYKESSSIPTILLGIGGLMVASC